ncbi:MAG TPA: ThuA domain-containing protein [Verrucomicrobiae bacterium]|jgi:type 1 glutamine amidotransferase|nr:ThuA domain-containing protein [Verrucomicrobiae bacterium]
MKKYLLGLFLLGAACGSWGAERKIIFVAGPPSHGPGEHEYRAGCLLLAGCLSQTPEVQAVVYTNGWPAAPHAFDDAASIVFYTDGGPGHPLLQPDHLKIMNELMAHGVGLVCLHYSVEPTIENGEKEFVNWLGGAFEVNWSVNPTWLADFKTLPESPITRGVQPFSLFDEWYFHMRFRPGMKDVTPILSAVPDLGTMKRKDGPHEGNPTVRAAVGRGELQCVAWAAERAGGGRAFGYTGGHFHHNWGDDNARKLVLNAILWTAKIEVPPAGVASSVTPDQLQQNLDPKPPRK